MMENKSLERAALTRTVAESNVFICTACGDGFSQYHTILTHMALHEPLESFPSSGSSTGLEFPKEYVLQENGTLTMIKGSQSANLPSSALSLASPLPPSLQPYPCKDSAGAKPPAACLHPSPCKDAAGAKPTAAPLHPSPCKVAAGAKPTVSHLDPASPDHNTERSFECTLCCQIFRSIEELRKHLHDHAHDRFYSCGLCGKRFLKMDSLNIHQKEYHTPPKLKLLGKVKSHGDKKVEKTYACKKCGSDFFWFTDFQTHSLYHCKGSKVKKPFKNLEVSHEIGQLNRTSTDFKPLAHTEVTDNVSDCPSYQCGLCGDRFNKLAALKKHHLIHQTQEEMDQLNQEGQITTSRINTMQEIERPFKPVRIKRRRTGSTDKFACSECHSVFNHSSSLSRHMRYHRGTMHTCVFCHKRFPQRCDVTRHIEMHHKIESEKEYGLKQKTCGSDSFDSQHGLAKQEKKGRQAAKLPSKSRGKYKCEDCGKKFGLLSVYQRHLRYHKEPTKNLSITSNNYSTLKLHLKKMAAVAQTMNNTDSINDDNKSHTKNDNSVILYECNECTQTFSSLQMFIQHQNSHSFKNCG